MSTDRFRFAPTPSRQLHLGNALAALYGWALARARGGTFVLRIEDIDAARCRPEYEDSIYRDLAWLGVDWDEGPDVGGAFGPYRQSERLDDYDRLLEALRGAGLAYPCACSRAEIRAAAEASGVDHDREGELPYPGTCRGRSKPLRTDRGGYRLDLAALHAHPAGLAPTVAWSDERLGPRREDVRVSCGDVLLGRPGQPTYQLAVVADDRAMRISHVVRGTDLVTSTARQILVRRALEIAAPAPGAATSPPRHLHHPLLLDAEGNKLSKRDRAIAIATFTSSPRDRLRAAIGRAVGLFGPAVMRASPADWIEAVASERSVHDGTWSALSSADTT